VRVSYVHPVKSISFNKRRMIMQYRVTFQTSTGPAAYTAHAASKIRAETAAGELYRMESHGGEITAARTVPVSYKIPEE
jgi:hypothetical protein